MVRRRHHVRAICTADFLQDFGAADTCIVGAVESRGSPCFEALFGLHRSLALALLEFNSSPNLLCDSKLRRTRNCIDAVCFLSKIQHLNNIILCPCGHRIQYIVVSRCLQAPIFEFWAVEAQNLVPPGRIGRSDSGYAQMFIIGRMPLSHAQEVPL